MANEAYIYRRNLPHIQCITGSYFVTFCTRRGLLLPESVRDVVLECCKHIHGSSAYVHCAVVMPDHVHMILSPYAEQGNEPALLHKILKGLKGTSARRINKKLGREGPLWQPESFDHHLRRLESAEDKADYIMQNPVRKGLVVKAKDYSWNWRPA
jgi:REP element-mobilizing transposase RayT